MTKQSWQSKLFAGLLLPTMFLIGPSAFILVNIFTDKMTKNELGLILVGGMISAFGILFLFGIFKPDFNIFDRRTEAKTLREIRQWYDEEGDKAEWFEISAKELENLELEAKNIGE